MHKHILVAVGFDDDHDPAQSFQVAHALAGKGTRVSVLHVQEQLPNFAIAYMPEGYAEELKVAIKDRLDALADQFENGTGVLVEGHSGRTILDWAEANSVDCIIIASHRPGLQDYLLGSTASRVVRHAQCSVHVVR